MGQIKVAIEDIYTNLILTAISHKCNFPKLVKETDEETKDYIESRKAQFLPEGYAGLYYTELLCRKMGSCLGDIYNLSEIRKDEIIRQIVESFDPISEAYGSYYDDDEDGIIEFRGLLSVLDISDEKEIMLYYADLFRSDTKTDRNVYVHYNVTFRKDFEVDGDASNALYSITISGAQDFSSDYVYDSYEIWEGKDGYFADCIEKVIAEYSETHAGKSDPGDDEDEADTESDEDENVNPIGNGVIEVEKPVIESEPVQDGPKIIDELITYIWDDTRTVDLLDRFEGYGQADPVRYRRIVIKNTKYTRYGNKYNPGFNLVIERGRGLDYVGNVTFTEFKKGEAAGLSQHIASEVTDDVIEQYIDKDQFFRFSKPFLLRAQNSSNRTGYGWEWDWSGGYGDYIEGTLYGETTNYFFVGVYVTTGYSYEASNRKPFVNKEKEDEKLIKEAALRVKDKIVFYEGKLNSITQNPTEQRFFKVDTANGSKYIPASYDQVEDCYYIAALNSQKHRKTIENGDYEIKTSIS